MTPSAGAKLAAYAELQSQPGTTIYDGMVAPKGSGTTAPPIHLYHSIFAKFYKFLAEAPLAMTEDYLRLTYSFMLAAATIYSTEDDRISETKGLLNRLLNTSLHSEKNSDGTWPDSMEVVVVEDSRIPPLIGEWKKGKAEGGSDASLQGSLSYRNAWLLKDVSMLLFCEYRASYFSKYRGRQSVNFVVVHHLFWQLKVPGFVFWVGC